MSRRRSLRATASLLALGATLWVVTTAAAADGPAAHWKLDETSGSVAEDAIASSDGTITGAASIVDGFDGGAFHFDGDDDVKVTGAAHLRSPDMVLSLWVRGDAGSPPAAGQVLVDNGNVLCGGNGYALVTTATWAKLVFRDAQANIGISTLQPAASIELPTLWDGEWHHVAVGAHADQDGFVYLFIDGWFVATTSSQPSDLTDGIAYGTSPTYPFVVGNDNNDCGPGFIGDIDDVRVYGHLLDRGELAGLEPEIETTLQITAVEPGAVQTDANFTAWFDLDVMLQPAPAMPGSFWVYLTGEDGVEHTIQRFDLGLGDLSADGHYDLAYFASYGGNSTIRVEYVPEVPALASEDSESVQIAKGESFTHLNLAALDVADEPITIGVSVHRTARVPATGTVELWEVTDTPVLIGSGSIEAFPGQWNGGTSFALAGRPAGDYQFMAKYFGSAANLPSESTTVTLTVLPGLETGEVVINGGDEATDNPIVEVSAPATGAIGMLITTDPDDPRQIVPIPYSETVITWITQPWYGDDADGVRTIWVKWADSKSRWSDWSTDTIILERGPAGTTTIEGGAGYTTEADVTVAVPIDEAGAVESVELSNDGTTWTSFDYDASIAWTLTSGPGMKTVRARWVDTDGKASMSVGDSIILDSKAPTATKPTMGIPAGSTIESGKVPVRLSWTGSDATSGVARYKLARSKDGGAFATVSTSLTTASSVRMLEPGHTYRFRVRPIDHAGNVGAWVVGSSFRLSAVQESSSRLDFDGGWKTASSSSAWGNASAFSKNAGATATITVNARSFAWVATVGPTSGIARVYVNGNLVATVDLNSTTSAGREVVFAKTWATARSRTIEIRVSGTAGHPRVDLDALAWGT